MSREAEIDALEISIVCMGADADTYAAIAKGAPTPEEAAHWTRKKLEVEAGIKARRRRLEELKEEGA